MKIATWNVNSIRKRLSLLLDWLERNRPDVVCLQETKVLDSAFPLLPLEGTGYHIEFRGKSAYNGVATLTLEKPERVQYGFRSGEADEDDRLLLTVVGGVTVVNTYIPQGYRIDSDRYAYKLLWFRRLRRLFEDSYSPADRIVWLGDVNVAPEPIDVYHADRRVMDPDFHIDARNAYKDTVSWGFIDVFRQMYPDRVQYTYWDYYRNAFEHDWGWRIDHILATATMAERCRAVDVDLEPRRAAAASDHTVLWADFDVD